MMPLEASSVIGSIAGLAELTKEAFGDDGASARPNGRGTAPKSGGSVPVA